VQLVRLDQVLGLSSGAIELFVVRFRQARQVDDDEPAVGPLGSGLDAGDDASLDRPAFGGVAEVAIVTDLFTFAVEAIERGVLGEPATLRSTSITSAPSGIYQVSVRPTSPGIPPG
jgi:hypothetical protein